MNVHSFLLYLCDSKQSKKMGKAKIFWTVIRYLMAAFMVYGGVQHFINTDFYNPFVPAFLPFKAAVIYISGVIEIAIGLLLLANKTAGIGSLLLLLLMLAFLPTHIWDVFSSTPAIGSHEAALVRLPVQLVFIGISWKLKNVFYK